MLETLRWLGVIPRVSNDNAYAESVFRNTGLSGERVCQHEGQNGCCPLVVGITRSINTAGVSSVILV